jgi:hypothetical protein
LDIKERGGRFGKSDQEGRGSDDDDDDGVFLVLVTTVRHTVPIVHE